MAAACCCHCLTFEMVNIWQKKKKTFLGHIRLLRAPGHSSSQDGSNSQVDQGTHLRHPFHSPFLDQWRGQGGKRLPLPIHDHGQEVPSAADSLVSQFRSGRHGLSKRNGGIGASDSGRATGWGSTPRRPFMSWDHYRWRLPVFHVILISFGRQWENIIIKPWAPGQASCCPSSKPNLQKSAGAHCEELQPVGAPHCLITCLHLPSFCLMARGARGHQPCARTCVHSWAGAVQVWKRGQSLSCAVGPRLLSRWKAVGLQEECENVAAFRPTFGSHYCVNNLSPPSLPTPTSASTFSTFYIKSTSNTFLPFHIFLKLAFTPVSCGFCDFSGYRIQGKKISLDRISRRQKQEEKHFINAGVGKTNAQGSFLV